MDTFCKVLLKLSLKDYPKNRCWEDYKTQGPRKFSVRVCYLDMWDIAPIKLTQHDCSVSWTETTQAAMTKQLKESLKVLNSTQIMTINQWMPRVKEIVLHMKDSNHFSSTNLSSMISPDSIHMNNLILTEQVVFRYICI